MGTNGLLKNVPVNKVREFEEIFLTTLEQKHPEVLDTFREGKLTDDAIATLKTLAAEISAQYS